MNHNDIINNGIIEQYVLGELDADQVKAFETHLFSCTDCLEELQRTELAIHQIQLAVEAHPQSVPEKSSISDSISEWLVGLGWKPALVLAVVLFAIYFIPGIRNTQMLQPSLETHLPTIHSTFIIENDSPTTLTIAPNAQFQIQINMQDIGEPTVATLLITDSTNNPVWKTENAVIDPNARYTLSLDASQFHESTFTFQCISSHNEILLKRVFSVQFK